MIIIRIRLFARADKQHELLQTAESLGPRISGEKGCVSCRVYQNTSNPLEIILEEEWESEKAVKRHLDSDSLTVLAGAGSILSSNIEFFAGSDTSMEAVHKDLDKKLGRTTGNVRL